MLLVAFSLLVVLECAQSRPTDLVQTNHVEVHSSVATKKPTDDATEHANEKLVNKVNQPQDANKAVDNFTEKLSKLEDVSTDTQPDILNHRQGKCFGYKGMC